MGIFDIFTNDAAEEAAAKNAALYDQYGRQASSLFNQYGTTATGALDRGVAASTGALDTGLTASAGALTGGIADAKAAGRSAIDAYQPLAALGQKYGGATSLYLDNLGVNGAEGNARGRAAFQAGPGYQFAVDQATDAAARKASSLGLAASGNTLDEIRSRAQGFADQEYNGYLDRLGGFVNPELSATSGAAAGTAAGFKNLSDLGMAGGAALGGLYDTDAARRAALYTNDATNRVGVAGNVTAGQAGVNRDVTTGQASANNAAAQAAQNGSASFWNGLMSLGSAAAKGYAGAR